MVLLDWEDRESWERTEIKFDFSLKCKIRLRTIREAIPFKPILTDVQKKWINRRNIKLDNLFSATLKTSSTVKDFYKRVTCQLLRSNNGHCELCGANFDSFHVFFECSFHWKN